jgi:hypothetical protein
LFPSVYLFIKKAILCPENGLVCFCLLNTTLRPTPDQSPVLAPQVEYAECCLA